MPAVGRQGSRFAVCRGQVVLSRINNESGDRLYKEAFS